MATIAELLIGIGIDPKGIENSGSKLAPKAKDAGLLIGKAMVAGAAVGLGAMGASVFAAMDRESVGDKVAAQLGLSPAEAKQAGDIAGRLYADAYGESFEQASDAVGAVMGTFDKLDPAGVERVSTKVLDLASAFDLDVTDAVARVSALLEGGLAKDADHAMDLITASFQKVAPGLREELADATREYAKHFGDLGITGEETLGLLAAADDQFTLDKTGDAIKELSIRATDMSALSEGAFEAMGLDAKDMADQILAGGATARGAFDDIVDGLLSIEDPTEQANTAIALFGTPIEDIGTAKIPAFLKSLDTMDSTLGNVTGSAQKMGDVLNDNAATRFETLKRGGMDLVVQLGEKLLPVFEKVLKWAQDAGPKLIALVAGAFDKISETAGKVSDWWKENGPTIIDKASEMAGVVRDVLLNAFQLLSDWWSKNGPAITAVALRLASGIKTAFAGLVTAAVWVRDNWEKVRPVLTVVATVITTLLIPHYIALGIAAMVSAGKNVAAWVMKSTASVRHGATILLSIGRVIAGWAMLGVKSLLHAAKVAAAWVIAMGPIGWVIASVVALVALIIANWDTVKKWTKAAWEWVSEKIAAVWGWIKTTVSSGVSAVVGFFTNLKDGVISKALALIDWWRGLPGRLIAALGNLGLMLFDAGKSIVTGLWDGIKSMGAWLADKITGWVKDKIPGPIASVLGISSPSKVTAGLGREVAAGLAIGMSKDLSLVERSAMRLAAASIPGISGISGGQVSVPAVSAMSGVSAGRANQQPPVYINNVYGWDDFVVKVREAGVDINRLGWQ